MTRSPAPEPRTSRTARPASSLTVRLLCLVLGLGGMACPSRGPGDGSPVTGPSGTPVPGPAGSTIRIGPAGVSPKSIEIALGGRVTFVNEDVRPHDMSSDPHPDHTICPEINQAGFLLPGQSRETGNFVRAMSCGFHDHDDPTDETLTGTITVR